METTQPNHKILIFTEKQQYSTKNVCIWCEMWVFLSKFACDLCRFLLFYLIKLEAYSRFFIHLMIFRLWNSLHIKHYSLLTTHCLPLTIDYLLFTPHYSLFTSHYLPHHGRYYQINNGVR